MFLYTFTCLTGHIRIFIISIYDKISVLLDCTYRQNLLSKFNIVERKQRTAFTTKLKFYIKFVIHLNYSNDKVKYLFLLSALIDFHPKIANKNCRSSGNFKKCFY